MSSTELVTPYSVGQVELESADTRRYRKQILPKADVEYHGRTLHFSDDYLSSLEASFRNRAFDQVPFQLDTGKGHSNDVEATAGKLVDVARTESGLDGIFELTERGEEVVKNNPELGVSARIIENFARGSKSFGHALQHVLGTVDPHIQGMSSWAAVEMSRVPGVIASLDLSDATYQEANVSKENTSEGGKVTLELSAEQHEQFLSLLSDYQAATELSTSLVEDSEEDDEDEAAESESTVQAVEDPRVTAQAAEIADLRKKLRDREIESVLTKYANEGLAPSVIAAARPLMDAEQPIELSRGDKIDVVETTTKLLDTVLDLASKGQAFIDLDSESGHYEGSDSQRTKEDKFLDAWDAEYGS